MILYFIDELTRILIVLLIIKNNGLNKFKIIPINITLLLLFGLILPFAFNLLLLLNMIVIDLLAFVENLFFVL